MNYSIIRYILCRVLEFQALFLALPTLQGKRGMDIRGCSGSLSFAGRPWKDEEAQKHGVLCKRRICDSFFELDCAESDRSIAPVSDGRNIQLYGSAV